MQEKSIFPVIVFQSRTPNFPINILLIIFRDIESCFDSSIYSSNAYTSMFQMVSNYSLIIPDSSKRLCSWKIFKFDSFKSFASNISSSLNKRRRKFWMPFSNIVIGSVMDRYLTIGFMFKTIFSDLVKHSVKKNNCFLEDRFIFLRNTEFKFNRSIHIHILHMIHYIGNRGVKSRYWVLTHSSRS
ncbi:hypothetical protein MSWHS_1925 [Methanosarcina sp. WWM596]|nr:hypothetical protein MSWHS_1925 [Methanosarcina sp. WWM596]